MPWELQNEGMRLFRDTSGRGDVTAGRGKAQARGVPPKMFCFFFRATQQHPQSHQAGVGGCLRGVPGSVWPQQGHPISAHPSSLVTTPKIHIHRGAPSDSHPQHTLQHYFCCPQSILIQLVEDEGWKSSSWMWEGGSSHPPNLGMVPWPLSRGASKLNFPSC